MDFDPTADFLTFDGLADVQYQFRGPRDTFADAVTVAALRRAVDNSEVPAGPAVLNRRAVVFHILASALSAEPKSGDRITEASGQQWAVDSAAKQTLNTRYRLVCVEIP